MTSNVPAPICSSRSTAVRLSATVAALLAIGTVQLVAQSSPPVPPPPPAAPAQQPAPALRPPPTAPTRSAVAPSAVPAAQRAPAPAVVLPMKRASEPPDSVRPAESATRFAPPANAVALCADGEFIVAPSDSTACAVRGGVRIVFPRRTLPVRPAGASAPAAASRPIGPSNVPPPASATMRCKDGTYLTGTPSDERCAGFGGVAVRLPAPASPPPAPRRP